uniref:YitH acetyltransferase (GNAT) domain-containing protein n=1 Tax=Ascaris lumbricoides TaxID=6252 RepID=A0A9J2P3M2_ASCLU
MVRNSLIMCAPTLPTIIHNTDSICDFPESSSTFLRDSNVDFNDAIRMVLTGSVSALVSMVKYSPTQAYCIIAEFERNLNGKYITVDEADDPRCLKIGKIKDTAENTRLLPVYIQVHHNPKISSGYSVLGQTNLELKKNVTVDLTENADFDAWRDRAGFIVTDRQQLRKVTVSVNEFLKSLQPSRNVKVVKLAESHNEKLLEYDHLVTALNRANFLQYLFINSTVFVAKREDDDAIVGYMVVKQDRILALYADSEVVAHTLVDNWLRASRLTKVSFCCRHQCWAVEQNPSSVVRTIHRRHTRAVPANIKWDRVYAINVGMHIV